MKKVFEFLLVLIIFYGVYEAFAKVLPLFSKDIDFMWVVLSALIAAALLVLIYSLMVRAQVSRGLKKHINDLQKDLLNKDAVISKKEDEIKRAQSFKEDLIKEAESYPQELE